MFGSQHFVVDRCMANNLCAFPKGLLSHMCCSVRGREREGKLLVWMPNLGFFDVLKFKGIYIVNVKKKKL